MRRVRRVRRVRRMRRVRRVRFAPGARRAWKRAAPGAPPLYSRASRSPSAHCNMSCTLQAWPHDSPSAGARAEVLLALLTRVVTCGGGVGPVRAAGQ